MTITAHELPGCPIPERSPNDPSPFRLTLTALGAFPESRFDIESDISVNDAGRALAFGPETSGVDAVARDAPGDAGQAFIGHTERRDADRIDVLLWPERRGCPVAAGGDEGYPGAGAGQALGFSPRLGVAVVAGEDASDKRAGSALAFDTETGEAGVVLREQGALGSSRAFATVTEFGEGLLVAGGTNPFSGATAAADASGTAEVYLPRGPGFEPSPIDLKFERTHHAALTLPSTGETLLVGGAIPTSAPDGGGLVIRQLEAVSPTTRRSSISDLATLSIGRSDPTALLLTNGRLFVGGGYVPALDPSEAPTPVGQVEWFSADATRRLFYAELPARPNRSFVALAGGGVLSVASCPKTSRADCACVNADGASCDPDDANWVDAWWLDADGLPERVVFAPGNVLASCPTPERPLLLPGSDGSPWLVSARGDGTACLWRFEPWPEGAVPNEDPAANVADPSSHARLLTTALTLDPAPDPRSPPLSLGPDALVWIASEGGLFGARLGHRGPLSRDDLPLVSRSEDSPFRPAHLAPDRDVHPLDGASSGAKPSVAFDGSLRLEPTNPPVTLWATDTLYDDVAISLDIDAAPDGAWPTFPELVLGGTLVAEPVVCRWPEPGPESPSPSTVHLVAERRGANVVLSASAAGSTTCAVPTGPVAVGVRAGATPTVLAAGSLRLARE